MGFMKEAGAQLAEVTKSSNAIFERFRAILHEGLIDKRVQYMIEVLFQVRKDKFKDNPPVPEELDLVDEADLITHNISLDQDDLKVDEELNIFKYDEEYEKREEAYKKIKDEVLGNDEDDDESGSGSEDGEGDESGSEEDEKGNDIEVFDMVFIRCLRKFLLNFMITCIKMLYDEQHWSKKCTFRIKQTPMSST